MQLAIFVRGWHGLLFRAGEFNSVRWHRLRREGADREYDVYGCTAPILWPRL